MDIGSSAFCTARRQGVSPMRFQRRPVSRQRKRAQDDPGTERTSDLHAEDEHHQHVGARRELPDTVDMQKREVIDMKLAVEDSLHFGQHGGTATNRQQRKDAEGEQELDEHAHLPLPGRYT